MRFAVLTSGQGWHMRDLRRAANVLDCELLPVSWRQLLATVALGDGDGLSGSELDLRKVDRISGSRRIVRSPRKSLLPQRDHV